MRIYKLKTIKRLRRKNLPACELMSRSDYDEWMTEEATRYKRTKEVTADLMYGLARGVRSAVAYVCGKHDLTCCFDDMLHDVLLLFLEKWLVRYDPVRSRITYYLSFTGYHCAIRCIGKYHTEHFQEEVWHKIMSPEPQDGYFIHDFIFDKLQAVKWRMNPAICSWIIPFILAGVDKKLVLKALQETVFKSKPSQSNILYNYTLVTVRIELAEHLERYSGGMLSQQSYHRILPCLREGTHAETD